MKQFQSIEKLDEAIFVHARNGRQFVYIIACIWVDCKGGEWPQEGYQGVVRSPYVKEARAKLQIFRWSVPILPVSLSVAKRCAALREQLKQEQKRVKARALDIMNTAIAIEYDLMLVTRNVEDYKDIPDLNLYPLAA